MSQTFRWSSAMMPASRTDRAKTDAGFAVPQKCTSPKADFFGPTYPLTDVDSGGRGGRSFGSPLWVGASVTLRGSSARTASLRWQPSRRRGGHSHLGLNRIEGRSSPNKADVTGLEAVLARVCVLDSAELPRRLSSDGSGSAPNPCPHAPASGPRTLERDRLCLEDHADSIGLLWRLRVEPHHGLRLVGPPADRMRDGPGGDLVRIRPRLVVGGHVVHLGSSSAGLTWPVSPNMSRSAVLGQWPDFEMGPRWRTAASRSKITAGLGAHAAAGPGTPAGQPSRDKAWSPSSPSSHAPAISLLPEVRGGDRTARAEGDRSPQAGSRASTI